MTLRRQIVFTVVAVAVLATLPAWAQAPSPPLPRTFPQFVGTWVLDEAASTGQLRLTPRIALTMTITTTPEHITVTRRMRLLPGNPSSESPPPEVYRLDGSETPVIDARTGARLSRSYRFTLVADMMALTVKEGRRGDGSFELVTDAYSVDGDVLILHRQLVVVTPPGYIATMGNPANNFRHTFIYRRQR